MNIILSVSVSCFLLTIDSFSIGWLAKKNTNQTTGLLVRLWVTLAVKLPLGSSVVTSSSKCCLVKWIPTGIVLDFRSSKCYDLPRCPTSAKHLVTTSSSGDGFRPALSGFDRKRVEPLLNGRQTATPFCSTFNFVFFGPFKCFMCHPSIKCQHISHPFRIFRPAQQKSNYSTQLPSIFLNTLIPNLPPNPIQKSSENLKPPPKISPTGKTTLTPGTVSFGRVGLAGRWRSHLRWGWPLATTPGGWSLINCLKCRVWRLTRKSFHHNLK